MAAQGERPTGQQQGRRRRRGRQPRQAGQFRAEAFIHQGKRNRGMVMINHGVFPARECRHLGRKLCAQCLA